MGFNRMGYPVDELARLPCQNLTCALGAQQVVVLAIDALRHIVQQRGGSDDFHIRPFGARDPLGQRGDAQHMVEVMTTAARLVQ